jgi:cytochrome c biogenesis protein ResB
MIAQTPRDPWRAIWRIASSDHLVAILLLSIAAGLALTVWLPQRPMADPVAYAQWLSEVQALFGETTPAMQTLGLFTITHSFGFRALLALLAACLLLRLIEGIDQMLRNRETTEPAGEWKALTDIRLPNAIDNLRRQRYRVLDTPSLIQADRWPWANVFSLLIYGSGLLLLVGLLINHLWGWQIEGLVVRGGEIATLLRTNKWIALSEDAAKITHSPGIVTFIEEHKPGVQARATDSTGQPLKLQQTAESPQVTQLTLALTEDRYFAIPEAQLVVRLAAISNHAVGVSSPVLVQIYHSPPGRLADEITVEGDVELTVDDVTLRITNVPYAQLTVIFNPGFWPISVGLVLLVVGLLGSTAWPERRLWLREEAGQVEGTGDILTIPALGEET